MSINQSESESLGQLLSHADGWSLSSVIDWLYNEGRLITDPRQFVESLGELLYENGVSLFKLQFAFRTLHPQVAACAFTWQADQDSAEFCLLHEDADSGELSDPELESLIAQPGMDAIFLPLLSSSGNNNVMSLVTRSPPGFSDLDIAKINALSWLLSPIIETIAARRAMQALLDTYIGPRSGKKVLDGLIKRGDGETIDAVIWYSDLRDFTELSETLAPVALISMLNAYFEYVTETVKPHGGEVLRFIGDAILIIFPVQEKADIGEVCRSAIEAVIDSLDKLEALNDNRKAQGDTPIRFGIGMHIGQLIYGNVGAPDRLEFTVIGAAANRAERIEKLTKELETPALFSAEIAARARDAVMPIGKFELRGIEEPQKVFELAPGRLRGK